MNLVAVVLDEDMIEIMTTITIMIMILNLILKIILVVIVMIYLIRKKIDFVNYVNKMIDVVKMLEMNNNVDFKNKNLIYLIVMIVIWIVNKRNLIK